MTASDPDQDAGAFVHAIGPRKRKGRKGLNYALIGLAVTVVGGLAAAPFVLRTQMFYVPADTSHLGSPSLSEAQHCLDAQDFPCAEADYRAYLIKYPNDSKVMAIMAMTLTRDGQHKEAVWYYRKAAAMGVSAYDFDANYAISLDNTGQTDEAIKMNYAALQIAPTLVDVRGALANQLVRRGRGQEALNLLESFDRALADQGQTPYFTDQIRQIRAKIGAPASDAPSETLATDTDQPVPASGAPASSGTPGLTVIPLQPYHGTLTVPVVVDDALTLRFTVDSGASDVTLPGDVARTLTRMGKLSRSDYLGSGFAVLADGSRVPAQLVVIHSLKVGGIVVHNVTASIGSSHGGELLLGQSFLRRFKSWSIDNRRRVLLLQN
jgi:clan AA aspartic protease (TIGR02281 family)